MVNGMRMNQNSSVLKSCAIALRRGTLSSAPAAAADALGGVGGLAGMKKEGRDATVAWSC